MLFLSIKQWRWFHVFIVNLLLISTLLLTQLTSYVLEFRKDWTQQYRAAVDRRDGLQAEVTKILHGINEKGEPAEGESLISLRRELAKALVGRGEVWEGIKLQAVKIPPIEIVGTTATVELSAATPQDHLIEAGDRFFLFGEQEIDAVLAPAQKMKVPAIYLGEYDVETVNGKQLTLKCTFAPRVFAPQLMNPANLTLAMYETMPADSHYKFARQSPKPAPAQSEEVEEPKGSTDPLFGEMDPQHITSIFQTVVRPLNNPNQPQRGIPNDNPILAKKQIAVGPLGIKLVQEFIRDGSQIIGDPSEVEPKNIYIQYTFQKDFPVTDKERSLFNQKVNGDDAQAGLLEAGIFQAGEAIDPMFYHLSPSTVEFNNGVTKIIPGKKTDFISFKAGETAYFSRALKIDGDPTQAENTDKKSWALDLFDRKLRENPTTERSPTEELAIVKDTEIRQFYVRSLHDFDYVFHHYEARLKELASSAESSQTNITNSTKSHNEAIEQIAYRKQEKKELEFDLELHRRDEHEAELYSQALTSEVENLIASLNELFKRNQVLAKMLTARQSQLEEAIDARTQEAENAAGNSEE